MIEKQGGIDPRVKKTIPMPLLQTGLTVAGAITQLSIGAVPKITPLPVLAERFCRRTRLITEISEEEKQLLQNFQAGIILANHPNKIMVDFPPWLQYLFHAENTPVRICTGITVTPMYGMLLPTNCESFLAEQTSGKDMNHGREVYKGVQDSIDYVNTKVGILILPYKEELGATHRKILKGIHEETPILEVTTEFPEKIGYVNSRLGLNSMYGRIARNFLPGAISEMHIKVGVDQKTKAQLSNR